MVEATPVDSRIAGAGPQSEITLEDFERVLNELLPKYSPTVAGKLAYVHSVLSFGLENPAPVEYLARCAIKEILHLRQSLTAAEKRVQELEAKYEAPPRLVSVMPPELFLWRNASKAQACTMVRNRTGCSLRDAMHSLREADRG